MPIDETTSRQMWKLDLENTRYWKEIPRTSVFAPKGINLECPFPECKHTLSNLIVQWQAVKRQKQSKVYAHASLICPECTQQTNFFLIDAPTSPAENELKQASLYQNPPPQPNTTYDSKEIDEISPRFSQIYLQAWKAQELGLNEVSGPGYRKALEFLVKDYACHQEPNDKETIKSLSLNKCIDQYMSDDEDIQGLLKRSAWLGNDEVHYSRKHEDKDVTDLKELIDISCRFISLQLRKSRKLKEVEYKK